MHVNAVLAFGKEFIQNQFSNIQLPREKGILKFSNQ